MDIFKKIFKEGTREALSQVFWVFGWPTVLVGGSTALMYLQGLPLGYLSVGALAAFAFTAHGLLKFDEWKMRRQVDGRFNFSSLHVGDSIRKDGTIVGLSFANVATFPIEFKVEKIITKIGDKVPKNTEYPLNSITVPALGNGWFYDHPIKLENTPTSGTADGTIEFDIKYGRSGHLKYHLKGTKYFVISLNEHGKPLAINWNDVR